MQLFLQLAVMAAACLGLHGLTQDEIAQFGSRGTLETNTGVAGWVNVEDDRGRRLFFTSNGIPDHNTGNLPANAIQEQSYTIRVKKNPVYADTPQCLPMGPIGMATNGVPFYNPQSIECEDARTSERFDRCHGHPDPRGRYHYHLNPICLYRQEQGQASPLVGVAADGFPIYGPVDETGRTLTSADLDQCHGREVNGQYRYHITEDYPYILGCFKGQLLPDAGVGRNCPCTVRSSARQQTLLDLLQGFAGERKRTSA